jgi:hypothetical protein
VNATPLIGSYLVFLTTFKWRIISISIMQTRTVRLLFHLLRCSYLVKCIYSIQHRFFHSFQQLLSRHTQSSTIQRHFYQQWTVYTMVVPSDYKGLKNSYHLVTSQGIKMSHKASLMCLWWCRCTQTYFPAHRTQHVHGQNIFDDDNKQLCHWVMSLL